MNFLKKILNKWQLNNNETGLRSFVKAYSYRCCGTLTTITISYFITGQFIVSLGIGFIEMIVKPFIYWTHERVWSRIDWGRL